jgi:2-dehydropantoate 2-reductase
MSSCAERAYGFNHRPLNLSQQDKLGMIQNNIPKMNYLVYGVGAIGTYVGGSLALGGQKVVFVERPEVAEAVNQNGLFLNLKGKDYHIRCPVVPSINEAMTLGPFDVVILAVKSYDTDAVIQQLFPFIQVLPPILDLQNGVENEGKLAEAFGKDKVIPGTVTTAVSRLGAGNIVVEKLRGMGVAVDHKLASLLVMTLQLAGLRANSYESATAMKWSKMLTNLLANASSAILDMPPEAIYAHPGLFRMETSMVREALQVMRKMGIGVVDLPGTPVRLLTLILSSFPLNISQLLLRRSVGIGRGDKMPSFHIDLASGRGVSEVDYLNGAVVRFGIASGVPTPVNRVLTETLSALTLGKIERKEFAHQPGRLLSLYSIK